MKLFVFDVDGTISDNLALKLDKDLIKELNIRLKNGDCVAIASGRPYIGIIQYLNQLGEGTKFCICANGASITDINGNILMKNTIKLKDFYEFCDTHKEILESKDGNIYTYLNDAVGYFKYDEFIKGETAFNNNFPALDLRNANLSPDTDILKFMVASLPEHSIEIENSIEKSWRDRFSVLRTSSVFIEFINKKTDKASGVEFLMNYCRLNIAFSTSEMQQKIGIKNLFATQSYQKFLQNLNIANNKNFITIHNINNDKNNLKIQMTNHGRLFLNQFLNIFV